MDEISYLPLGSIVVLSGSVQKLIIIARGLTVKNDGKNFFFDYGGVPYPVGLSGDRMAYFNASSVAHVLFEGYRDADEELAVENINRYLKENPNLPHADPEKWNVKG